MVSNHTDSQFRYCFEWFTRTCETANTAETMVAIWQVRAVKFDNKQILRALADPLYYITPHFQMKCPHESPITQHITYTTSWGVFPQNHLYIYKYKSCPLLQDTSENRTCKKTYHEHFQAAATGHYTLIHSRKFLFCHNIWKQIIQREKHITFYMQLQLAITHIHYSQIYTHLPLQREHLEIYHTNTNAILSKQYQTNGCLCTHQVYSHQ